MAASSASAKDKDLWSSLPLETQKQIFRYVPRRDLFNLQTISSHFHGLAAAEIYRTLDFNVVSTEQEDLGAPSTRAADAFQTILASEHDYGQHIKAFRMGAVASGVTFGGRHYHAYEDQLIMTRLLWDAKTDPSKFLNTAVLLMARKASKLETFKWDAPIELSSDVYRTLQKISSLRHLLIRLDVQPCPKVGIRTPTHHLPGHPPPPPGFPTSTNLFSTAPTATSTSPALIIGSDPLLANTKKRRPAPTGFFSKRQHFSGFQNLYKLELVGISSHDILPEISQCIKASSSTLKSLTLTLSAELAKRSRKPANNIPAAINDDLSESDLDDEDDDLIDPPLPSHHTVTSPANEADIREEKLAQENILATVFDLQSVAQVGKKLEKKLSLSGGRGGLEDEESNNIQEQLNGLRKSLQTGPQMDPVTRVEQLQSLKNQLDSFLKTLKDQTKKPIKLSASKSAEKHDNAKQKFPLPGKKKITNPHMASSSFKQSSLNPPYGFDPVTGELDPPFGSLDSKSSPYSSSHNYTDLLPPPPLPNPSSGSYSFNGFPPMSYSHSHTSSGSHTPTMSSSLYYPQPSHTQPILPYSTHMEAHYPHPNKSSISLNKHSKYKPKKYASQYKFHPPKHVSVPSSDGSDEEAQSKAAYSSKQLVDGALGDKTVESMDVDLEHPDVDMSDPGEDQEHISDVDDFEVPSPRKRLKARDSEPGSPSREHIGESSSMRASPAVSVQESTNPPTVMSATEAMQEYVRATHGLPLEEICLHWIPMKASILGRALDLTTVQRITLLDVGPQDAFWALLSRLTNVENVIAFKSIHTDFVSPAFTDFLATFHGLEELFMHERYSKGEPDAALTVDISRIRKTVLGNHMSTLKRLMIRNEKDESWDIDPKTLHFLAVKGKRLIELSCSMRMQTYHVLIQLFAAFSHLHALHLISLRSTDRNMVLQLESLSFAIDGLAHCPNAKLRYLALSDQLNTLETRPNQFRKHLKLAKDEKKSDKKGKGKAVDGPSSNCTDLKDDFSDLEVDNMIAATMAGESKVHFPTRFEDVHGVKIFTKEVRTGRI